MADVLDSLLEIKKFRENSAHNELQNRRRIQEERARDLERSQDDLRQYHAFRERREVELFEEIRGKLVTLRELDDQKMQIHFLREKEANMEGRVLEAENALNKAKDGVDEARRLHQEASRTVEKYRTFIDIQRQAERREAERREELELEEHPVTTREEEAWI